VAVITKGRDAVKAKGIASRDLIDTIHDQYCSEPIVGGNFFSVVLRRDVTFKNKQRLQLEEICVFNVNEGKIISEQYFY